MTYYLAGRFAESEAHVSKVARARSRISHGLASYLGKTLLAQGKPEAALAMVQQEADEGESTECYLPILLQAAGRQAEADEALQAQIARWADTCAYLCGP